MNTTIWKFPFKIEGHVKIEVPFGAEIIHVGLDPNGDACIWAEVDPDKTREEIDLFVVGTGHAMPELPLRHRGSIIQGSFVWHIYTYA